MSTTSNENIFLAKSFIDHVDSLNESQRSNYFQLNQLKSQVSMLHDEFIELDSIDPSDELASIAQEECCEISMKIRDLLKTSTRNVYFSKNLNLFITTL